MENGPSVEVTVEGGAARLPDQGGDSGWPADSSVDPDLAEVVRRELRLLRPQVRTSSADVLALLHPDFLEFGASGGVWDFSSVTTSLDPARIEATDLSPVKLSMDVVLVTYVSHHQERPPCRRSSIWLGTHWRPASRPP